jgi:hypothetical protein
MHDQLYLASDRKRARELVEYFTRKVMTMLKIHAQCAIIEDQQACGRLLLGTFGCALTIYPLTLSYTATVVLQVPIGDASAYPHVTVM